MIEKSGSWFNYGDVRLGQGRENVKQHLRDNTQLADEIAAKVIASRSASGGTPSVNGVAAGDDDDGEE